METRQFILDIFAGAWFRKQSMRSMKRNATARDYNNTMFTILKFDVRNFRYGVAIGHLSNRVYHYLFMLLPYFKQNV